MVGIPRGFERYRPWWRGWYQGYGFNPVADLPGLALYHDVKVQDSTFQGLPGMAYAINQNDGIGAVLDLKRYKERGPELVTTPEIEGLPISDPENTTAASNYDTGADVEAGKIYEVEYTVTDYAGTENVGFLANVFPLAAVTRQSGNGTWKFIAKAVATGSVLLLTRKCNTANFSGISVREVPGYHAIQDLAAAQPVLNIEGGIRSARADGVDDRLVIPNSASAFNFLHNGEGGEAWVCCRAATAESGARYVFGNGTTTEVGVLALFNGSRVQTLLSNASGSSIATAQSATGVVVAGEKAVYRFSYQPDEVRVYKGGTTLVAQAALSGTPSSADAARNMTIGNWASTAGTFAGDVYAWGIIQGALSDYDAQRLATYMLRRAGA